MIKVNLMRNRVSDGAGTEVATTAVDQNREALVKIAGIVIFTLLLMVYEHMNISSLNQKLGAARAQVNQLDAQNKAKLAEVDKIKDIEGQAKELEDKLKILKTLSRLRLREVKTMDFMQSSIPEKVWLKSVVYESDKNKVSDGHFSFQGWSVATDDLTQFVKRLEDSAYLQNVIVIKNQEVTLGGKGVPLREFLFSAEVENSQ